MLITILLAALPGEPRTEVAPWGTTCTLFHLFVEALRVLQNGGLVKALFAQVGKNTETGFCGTPQPLH